MTNPNEAHPLKQELLSELSLETAQIEWQALERFFAAGTLIFVDSSLNLVETAAHMAQDNKSTIDTLIKCGKIQTVTDLQALQWQTESSLLWAVVIKPWVLIQEND